VTIFARDDRTRDDSPKPHSRMRSMPQKLIAPQLSARNAPRRVDGDLVL